MEREDIPAMAALDMRAMEGWGVAQAMQNGIDIPREQFIIQLSGRTFPRSETVTWVKVVDTDLDGQMIAAALWRFTLKQEEPQADHSAPTGEVDVPVEQEGGIKFPPVGNEMGRLNDIFEKEYIRGRPHARQSWCSFIALNIH